VDTEVVVELPVELLEVLGEVVELVDVVLVPVLMASP
jgi:hypothetical protein